MKAIKVILSSMVVLVAAGCQASESKGSAAASTAAQADEATIRQRVEQMQQVGYLEQDKILSQRLQNALNHAHSIFNVSEDDTYVGFEWSAGVMDVCGDKEPSAIIDGVEVIDGSNALVGMRYVDTPCYDIGYTLHLVAEGGEWVIDDVDYPEQDEDGWGTLTGQCEALYRQASEALTTEPAADIVENILYMEPTDDNYTDPATIYYNNPKEVQRLVDQVNNSHRLLKKNPGYTPAMGRQLDEMAARIKQHL